MLTFEVIITDEEIELSQEGESALLHDTREALEQQARSGIDRDGKIMIGKKGQRLDLHDKGELWSNVTEAPAQGGLVFNSRHALVLEKYKADALSEANLKTLEERVNPTLDEQVTLKAK